MLKFRFIDSLKDERKRNEDTVKTTVIKMMIFELKELLVNAEMFLTSTNEMMMKMKKDS